jgi:hypothetical protein
VTDLFTLDDVARQLRVTSRQLRRLRQGPDPLPVVHLSRKLLRVDPAALDAWLARRQLPNGLSDAYTSLHDWHGDAAVATAGRALPTGLGHQGRPALELDCADGTRGNRHPRGGRPRSALRHVRVQTEGRTP